MGICYYLLNVKYHVISAFCCAILLLIYAYITVQLVQLPVSWFDHACRSYV